MNLLTTCFLLFSAVLFAQTPNSQLELAVRVHASDGTCPNCIHVRWTYLGTGYQYRVQRSETPEFQKHEDLDLNGLRWRSEPELVDHDPRLVPNKPYYYRVQVGRDHRDYGGVSRPDLGHFGEIPVADPSSDEQLRRTGFLGIELPEAERVLRYPAGDTLRLSVRVRNLSTRTLFDAVEVQLIPLAHPDSVVTARLLGFSLLDAGNFRDVPLQLPLPADLPAGPYRLRFAEDDWGATRFATRRVWIE